MKIIARFMSPLCIMSSVALGLPVSAQAHDFWVSPASYNPDASANTNISIMVGHPEDHTSWAVSPHRIVGFRSFGPDGVTDRQNVVSRLKINKAMPMSFDVPGVHILTIETTDAFSKLKTKKFNDYLDEEGLTPVKIDRVSKRKTDTPGKELYSRRGKAIINVGNLEDANPPYLTRPVGLTLEVVPTANPGRLNKGDDMSAYIYYRGEKTSGITIGLVSLDTDQGLVTSRKSDKNGFVTFKRPVAGHWMLHAVWSDPLEDTERADYDTIFSSLSFSVN